MALNRLANRTLPPPDLKEDLRKLVQEKLMVNENLSEAKKKRITKLHSKNYPKGTHYCATHVEHAELGIGTTITEHHAKPDQYGDIDWYDVKFADHGIVEQVPTDHLTIILAEMHENHKSSLRFKTFITELNVIPGNAATVVQGIAGRFPNTFKRATRDDQPEGTPLSSPRTSEKDRGSDLGFVVNAKKEDEINAQKPEAKRKLETDALKKVVRSDEYKNASEEERSKMLETGISSVGDTPSIEGSDAEFRVSQDQRAKNIDSQTRKDFESMTPEEKMLTPDEMRKRGLIGSKYGQKKSVSTGRPLNPNNPFGPKISTPDDKNSKYQYIPNKPRQYANRDRAKLFAAQDDLSTLKQGIGDRARQRIQRDSPILNQADRDIASMNRKTATAKRQSIAKASFGKQP